MSIKETFEKKIKIPFAKKFSEFAIYDLEKLDKSLSYDQLDELCTIFYKIMEEIERTNGKASLGEDYVKEMRLVLEQKIISLVEARPEILLISFTGVENASAIVHEISRTTGYEQLKTLILSDERFRQSRSLQDYNGQNMGMILAQTGQENYAMLALDDKEASQQQDRRGNNIGTICARKKLPEATKKALSNKKASRQQNTNGYNIGMICAENLENPADYDVWSELTLLALGDRVAREQVRQFAFLSKSINIAQTVERVLLIPKKGESEFSENELAARKAFLSDFQKRYSEIYKEADKEHYAKNLDSFFEKQ